MLPRLLIAALALLASTASAAPRFGADEDTAALAGRIWEAGVACTGWEPAAAPHVPIAPLDSTPWAAGSADVHPSRGLERIHLAPASPWTGDPLVHEVAHAWAHSHTSALSEGVAQVLATCMAQRLGLRIGTGPSLPAAVPDLRTWDPRRATPDERTAGYELARRLARARLVLFGPEAVWGPAAPTHLADLRADLAARGARGRLLDRLLDTPAALADFLRDEDHDDLPDGVEALLDLDPLAWDTDGDGWWDGASIDLASIPLPADRAPLCLPAAAGWRLADDPLVWTRSLERWGSAGWEPWVADADATLPPARLVRRGRTSDWWSGWAGRGGSRLEPVGAVEGDAAPCPDGAIAWTRTGDDLVRAPEPTRPG